MKIRSEVLREPLLHFVVLGALLYGAWRVWAPRDDARVIRIDAGELAAELAASQGREPTEEERQRLLEARIDRELLYREGLRLGLDREDPVIARRVVQKMEFVIGEEQVVAEPTDEELRAFVEAHAERYGGPQRRDFAVLTFVGAAAAAQAERARQRLLAGEDVDAVGGRKSTGKRFTPANTLGTFGPVIAEAVARGELGGWEAVDLDGGVALVGVTGLVAPEAPTLDRVRAQASADYAESQRREAVRRRLEALRGEYTIEVEP